MRNVKTAIVARWLWATAFLSLALDDMARSEYEAYRK